MSGWMSVCHQTFFKSLLLLQFFSDSNETWHTLSICQYAKKTGTYFRNFDLVNFWQFFELLHLDLVSGAFIVAKSSNSD